MVTSRDMMIKQCFRPRVPVVLYSTLALIINNNRLLRNSAEQPLDHIICLYVTNPPSSWTVAGAVHDDFFKHTITLSDINVQCFY